MKHCTMSISNSLNTVGQIRPDFAYEGRLVRSQ
jgi:hypothetical protein